ncbi:MAG: hypothetical protein R6T98_15740 [Desulfatiglandales bacterium]
MIKSLTTTICLFLLLSAPVMLHSSKIFPYDYKIDVLENGLKIIGEYFGEYDLTGPEKLALLTGDVEWIEQEIGPLTRSQRRWLDLRRSAEIW